MSASNLSNLSVSPMNSPLSQKSPRNGNGSKAYIFVKAKKYRTDTILAASIELRKRGFVVEVEQETKNGASCHFLLSLSPALLQKLALTKNYEPKKPLTHHSPLQQLILLNSAIDIITESCTFLEGREAWIAHDKSKFDSFLKESNIKTKLSKISDYFGPQIALYFGWLYHYTSLLIYPSLFGIITFAHQYYYSNIDSSWMPFYAIFIALWTTVFLELSKRNCAVNANAFGVLGLEEDKEALKKYDELTQYTKKDSRNKSFRQLLSFGAIMILIYIMIEIMLYAVDKQLRAEEIYGKDSYWKYFPSILYSVIPIIASSVFQPFAEYLTDFEGNSVEEDHERSIIFKEVALQFVNRYCGLLYIAFYLRDLNLLRSLLISLLVNGAIINNVMELGVPWLKSWYAIYSKKKAATANTNANANANPNTPTSNGNSSPVPSTNNNSAREFFPDVNGPSERDKALTRKFDIIENELAMEEYDLNDDYMEMVIQFGYITMFAVVFPLTPVLALVNNIFEPTVDLTKLTVCKRSHLKLRSTIGAWQTCFEFIAVVAVITNCFLLAIVSTRLDVLIPNRFEALLQIDTEYGRILVMLVLEHLLLGLKIVLGNVIDDIPPEVREEMAKRLAEKTESNIGKTVELFTHQTKSMAYDKLAHTAEKDPNADSIPLKNAVLLVDKKIKTDLMIADQVATSNISSAPKPTVAKDKGNNGKQSTNETKELDATSQLKALFERDAIGFHPIILLSIVFLPYLCAYYNFPLLLYIPIALLVLTYIQSQKDRADRQIAVGVVTDANLLKLIGQEMPSWFHDSEFQRVEWLNFVLSKLFPQIAHAVEAIVKEKVQPSIDENTPFYLPRLEIVHANLGSVSPKITGVRVFHNRESSIRLDLELKWSSDLQVTLKLNTTPLPINVELTDLRVTANVRVELLELTNRLPCFRALSITCMTKPKIDFSLKIASLDIMNMGAGSDYNITSLVQTIIDSVLAGVCLYPKKIMVPMDDKVDLDDLANETPDGILLVRLIRGQQLLAVNYTGNSDPYVEFVSSHDPSHIQRSTVKYSTIKPVWHEDFTFFVYDKNTETITVSVYDSDITNQMPTFMGNAVIHLDLIKRNHKTPQEFNLVLTDVSTGILRVSCAYRSINKKKSAANLHKMNERGEIIEDHVLYTDIDEKEFEDNTPLIGEDSEYDDVRPYEEGRDTLTEMPNFNSPNNRASKRGKSIDDNSSDVSSIRGRRLSNTFSSLQNAQQKMEDYHKSLEQMVGVLNISQIKLKDIKLPDGFLTSTTLRLYVTFTIGNKTLKTKYIKNSQDPTFIETFAFLINSLNEEMVVNVYNKVKYTMSMTPKPIASVKIALKSFAKNDDDFASGDGKNRRASVIQKVEQDYPLNGLKDEGYVSFKAVLSLFD